MINDYTNYVSGNEFINKNANVKTEFDYNSFYRAYVIDNNDPEKLGRVKIQIPSLHKNSSFYPWAYPGCLNGFGYQVGQFILPPIGSVVFVTFEYSDSHIPIYFGGIPTKYAPGKSQNYGLWINDGESRTVTGDDIPTEYTGTQQIIYKAPTGDIIYIDSDDDNNAIVIKNTVGCQFSIVNGINEDNEIEQYLEMKYDDDNYFRIGPDYYTWYSNGEPVDIGGGGGTGDGKARTVIWD